MRHQGSLTAGEQVEQVVVVVSEPDPRFDDPDMDYVPWDLRLLAGLNHGRVTTITEDRVSNNDVLVLVPSLFKRAYGVEVDED